MVEKPIVDQQKKCRAENENGQQHTRGFHGKLPLADQTQQPKTVIRVRSVEEFIRIINEIYEELRSIANKCGVNLDGELYKELFDRLQRTQNDNNNFSFNFVIITLQTILAEEKAKNNKEQQAEIEKIEQFIHEVEHLTTEKPRIISFETKTPDGKILRIGIRTSTIAKIFLKHTNAEEFLMTFLERLIREQMISDENEPRLSRILTATVEDGIPRYTIGDAIKSKQRNSSERSENNSKDQNNDKDIVQPIQIIPKLVEPALTFRTSLKLIDCNGYNRSTDCESQRYAQTVGIQLDNGQIMGLSISAQYSLNLQQDNQPFNSSENDVYVVGLGFKRHSEHNNILEITIHTAYRKDA